MSAPLNHLANLGHFVPELVVSFTMICLILLEATYNDSKDSKCRPMIFWVSCVGLFVTIILLFLGLREKAVVIFTGSLVIDPFSSFIKLVMALGTLGAISLSRVSKDLAYNVKSEFVILALGVLLGGMLLSSANNMLVLYIGIEMLSILSYVMASLKKHDEFSSEAGLKYALYGGVSSAVMLFGMGHIFGVFGTIHFAEIAGAMKGLTSPQILILMPSFVLLFIGLGYKIACVPFHMWAPDVYEGSPLPVTTFFSIVPKMAAIAALTRVTFVFFLKTDSLQYSWIGLIQVVAILTMTVGNISAIQQLSVKRMLAYSSISHAGMMMLGILTLDTFGATAILFYGFSYLFMTLLAFGITSFVQDQYGNDHFERFNGLLFRYPLMSLLMALVMFSLAGIPPFLGFVAKFHIIATVVSKKLYVVALFAVLNSVISLYYYLKIVKLMVFRRHESEETIEGFTFFHRIMLTGLGLPIVLLGFFWSKLYSVVKHSTLFFEY